MTPRPSRVVVLLCEYANGDPPDVLGVFATKAAATAARAAAAARLTQDEPGVVVRDRAHLDDWDVILHLITKAVR